MRSIIQNPLACVCLACSFQNTEGRWEWFGFAAATIAAQRLSESIAKQMGSIQSGEDAIRGFLLSHDFSVSEIPPGQAFHLVGSNGWGDVRIFRVSRRGSKRLVQAKAYISPLGLSLVFLPRQYSASHALDEFVLRHEMEHVGLHGRTYEMYAIGRRIFLPLVAFGLLTLISTWPMAVLFGFYMLHVTLAIGLLRSYGEVIADSFALLRMDLRRQFEAIGMMIDLLESDRQAPGHRGIIAEARQFYLKMHLAELQKEVVPYPKLWHKQTLFFDYLFAALFVIFGRLSGPPAPSLVHWMLGVGLLFVLIRMVLGGQLRRVNRALSALLDNLSDREGCKIAGQIARSDALKNRTGFVSNTTTFCLVAFGFVFWLAKDAMLSGAYLSAPVYITQMVNGFRKRLVK